jgi:hypothetical protein
MKIYFILENNKHEGPYTIEELKAKGITRDTLVWKEGLPAWVAASEVEELDYILPAPVPVKPPVPPPPPPPPVVEEVKPVIVEQPPVEEKKQEPVVVEEVKPEPKEEIVAPIVEPKLETVPEPAPKKEVFALADETPPPAVKPAETKPVQPAKPVKAAPTAKTRPAAGARPQKKKVSSIIIMAVILVLAGGGIGYYLYDQNKKAKEHTAADTSNVLQPDTVTAVNPTTTNVPQPVDTSHFVSSTNTADTTSDQLVTKEEPLVVQKTKTDAKNIKDPKDKSAVNTPPVQTPKKTDTKTDVVPVAEEKTPSKANPLVHLDVSGNYKKNFFGEAVLEGKVHNSDIDAKFNTVVFEVQFLSATGEVLKSQQFTKQGTLAPGGDLTFKFRTTPPKETKTAKYKILSAQ